MDWLDGNCAAEPGGPQASASRLNDFSHFAYEGHKRLATTDGMKSNCVDTPPPGMTHAQMMGILVIISNKLAALAE